MAAEVGALAVGVVLGAVIALISVVTILEEVTKDGDGEWDPWGDRR